MTVRPYTDLINVPEIGWYRDESDYIAKVGVQPPVNWPQGQRKLWIDTSWFWEGSRTYNFLARNADGTFALAGLDDARVASTYSLTALSAYRAHSDMFPAGVPYFIQLPIKRDEAQTLNFVPNPPGVLDYPLNLRSDWMLIRQSPTMVVAISIEEFNQWARPKTTTDEQRVASVMEIGARSGMTAAAKVVAMRNALTVY